MTNKTLQFYGLGFGENVTVTATLNGTQVYNGMIPSENSNLPVVFTPEKIVSLFTCEIPNDLTGIIPMTITVNSGLGVAVGLIEANYSIIDNPIFSSNQLAIINNPDATPEEKTAIYELVAVPPLSTEEIAILNTKIDIPVDVDPSTHPELIEMVNVVQQILTSHNLSNRIEGGVDSYLPVHQSGDCKTNVTINGIDVTAPYPRPSKFNGDWTYLVPVNLIFAYDLTID